MVERDGYSTLHQQDEPEPLSTTTINWFYGQTNGISPNKRAVKVKIYSECGIVCELVMWYRVN